MNFMAAVAIAFSVTILFMTALRPLAVSIGLVDRPGGRKAHIGDIPVIGGVAMFAGISFGFTLIPNLHADYLYLLLSGGLLVSVGMLDDRYDVPPAIRLITQTCAVIIMVYGGGVVISDIGDLFAVGNIQLGPLTLLFTVLITLTVINAFNFVDGVDGLAGSMSIIALVSVACAGGAIHILPIVAVVSASVIGFLVFNYPVLANRRLRSFMGDAGSTLLGLIVVWLTIRVCQGAAAAISPVTGLWFVAVPLFDLFTCLTRRIIRGRSPFRPGREHFHHLLYRAGLTVTQTLGVLTVMAVLYAVIGLTGHYMGAPESLMFLLWAIFGLSQFIMLRKAATFFRHYKRRLAKAVAS